MCHGGGKNTINRSLRGNSRANYIVHVCMNIYCTVYTMTVGEIMLIGRWVQRGDGNEKVRDCGVRGRIKVIIINKGMKKTI